ncbi:MAG: phosphoribosyl-ATP diphosphatase [Candidatus Hodgkinia cicadicola]
MQTALHNLNLAAAVTLNGDRREACRTDGACSNRVPSYTLASDSYSARPRTSLANSEISDLCRSMVASSQSLVGRKSWTIRMLDLGFKAVLKKVNEEAAEFALAVCCESSETVLREAADTIYHTVLSLLASGLNLNGLLRNLSFRSGWVGGGPLPPSWNFWSH